MLAILLWLLSLVLGAVLLYWIITGAINFSAVASIRNKLSSMKNQQSSQHTELMRQMREMQLLMKEQNELLREFAYREKH